MSFKKGLGDNEITYPLTQEGLESLKGCRLVNPMVGDNHGYKIPDDFDLEKSLQEIVQVRLEVTKNIFPKWFFEKHYPFKEEFGKYEFPSDIFAIQGLFEHDPQGLAEVVHMDSPSDMPKMLLKWLTNPMYGQNVNVKTHTKDYINFLETIPNVEEQIGDGVKRALYKAFRMKYYFGAERVEERWSAQTGLDGKLLTAYDEGCPNHPSAPAGHASAAAGGTVSLIKEVKELSNYQLKNILDTAYSWAMFRSLAGVHDAMDNILGLMANGFERYMRKDIVNKYKVNA